MMVQTHSICCSMMGNGIRARKDKCRNSPRFYNNTGTRIPLYWKSSLSGTMNSNLKFSNEGRSMKRLGVIPSDPIEEYLQGGYAEAWLRDYYNPSQFFDEVYLLSPLEKDRPEFLGMRVVHTPVEELKQRVK